MKLPEKIIVGKRTYKVCIKPRRKIGVKLVAKAKDQVWLIGEDGKPFLSDWPLRLYHETTYKEVF